MHAETFTFVCDVKY